VASEDYRYLRVLTGSACKVGTQTTAHRKGRNARLHTLDVGHGRVTASMHQQRRTPLRSLDGGGGGLQEEKEEEVVVEEAGGGGGGGDAYSKLTQ